MTGRWARLGLRPRLLVVSVVGVAVALLVGGLLLYAVMTAALNRAVEGEARSTAREVAALVDAGRLPESLPVTGAQVVQVLDRQYRVVAGSPMADRLTPLVSADELQQLKGGGSITVPGRRTGLSGDLQVAAVQAGPATERVTVVAALPTADLETSQRLLRRLLLVFFPLFLVALAAIVWRVSGSALRPVEELREGAERIGAGGAATSGTSERLPVPPTRDEVAALATTLNGMLDRLAGAQERQRAFVADAAHELRSPLATMRTQLEVAERLGDGGDLPKELLPEVERLSALVEDLLVLARSADRTARRPVVDVDVRGLLDDVARRYAAARVPVVPTAPAVPGSLAVPGTSSAGMQSGGMPSGGTAPLVVRAVRDELFRAVANLVDNAVRHADSRVQLAAARRGGTVEVVVTDDGHGIPEGERERVFDRFARLDEARDRDSGGTGLGLPITRELVRRAGGAVRLEDAAPGVRAVVSLPAAPAQSDPAAPVASGG
ncbi:Signal transduction histidine kinase [Pedococcus cremeus]|uniref:histidine kinase n=1 Tax=Pedococcus cremeus TaxID=587636 RepID=A0A1H9WMN5_9MICO|nr:ATP-binding protein [Pedococcus cremeus]SES35135.1 Signal transduction histidine kinase [Pedococcus cremeus]